MVPGRKRTRLRLSMRSGFYRKRGPVFTARSHKPGKQISSVSCRYEDLLTWKGLQRVPQWPPTAGHRAGGFADGDRARVGMSAGGWLDK